mmetsp:Transcript_26373/g.61593  ORF Transcript_26373/g.61593 Transcript_26373/m.61593 type:complete len:229 (+) Transcript_26373:772-1458(+)
MTGATSLASAATSRASARRTTACTWCTRGASPTRLPRRATRRAVLPSPVRARTNPPRSTRTPNAGPRAQSCSLAAGCRRSARMRTRRCCCTAPSPSCCTQSSSTGWSHNSRSTGFSDTAHTSRSTPPSPTSTPLSTPGSSGAMRWASCTRSSTPPTYATHTTATTRSSAVRRSVRRPSPTTARRATGRRCATAMRAAQRCSGGGWRRTDSTRAGPSSSATTRRYHIYI